MVGDKKKDKTISLILSVTLTRVIQKEQFPFFKEHKEQCGTPVSSSKVNPVDITPICSCRQQISKFSSMRGDMLKLRTLLSPARIMLLSWSVPCLPLARPLAHIDHNYSLACPFMAKNMVDQYVY